VPSRFEFVPLIIYITDKSDKVKDFRIRIIIDSLLYFCDPLTCLEDHVSIREYTYGTGRKEARMLYEREKRRHFVSLVEAEHLCKDYLAGEIVIPALKDISFSIEPGSFVSFVGPSGSGKTTLLNLIGCLDTPTKGTLCISGADPSMMDARKRALFRGKSLGFIFQDFNLIPVLTVYENIEYPLVMVQNVPAHQREGRVMKLLESVGMADQKDKYPHQLSGGQKQRTAVARALVSEPQLVLADEPTANLDHKTAHLVISLMKQMRDTLHTTFIFSTHDPKVVAEAEMVYYLEDGELKKNGAVSMPPCTHEEGSQPGE
jgi:putative ABC transport system ATP-binding protein